MLWGAGGAVGCYGCVGGPVVLGVSWGCEVPGLGGLGAGLGLLQGFSGVGLGWGMSVRL